MRHATKMVEKLAYAFKGALVAAAWLLWTIALLITFAVVFSLNPLPTHTTGLYQDHSVLVVM